MSFLDGLFVGGGTELEVAPGGEIYFDATIEPGWIHVVGGTEGSPVLTLVTGPLDDVVGHRVAVKVTGDGSGVTVVMPAGMLIEGDAGVLGPEVEVEHIAGNYREWICNSLGVWLLVAGAAGGGGGTGGGGDGDGVGLMYAIVPFTLRKVSTDVDIAEEIGVLRFDGSRFPDCSFALVAEMDVSVTGQTAVLQVVSLADSSVLATLQTSALTTTKRTAVVTLPSAEVLYSARLKRQGGDTTQHVSCRSVIVEVIHA